MKELETRQFRLAEPDGFTGNGVQFSVAHATAILRETFTQTIDRKVRSLHEPMYDGELEALFLKPLYEIAEEYLTGKTTNPDAVIKAFITQALVMGIFDQLFSIYEVREVAKTISSDMINESPLFRAISEIQEAQLDAIKNASAPKDSSSSPKKKK